MNRKWTKFSEKLPCTEWVFITDGEKVFIGRAITADKTINGLLKAWKIQSTRDWANHSWATLRLPNPPTKASSL